MNENIEINEIYSNKIQKLHFQEELTRENVYAKINELIEVLNNLREKQ